MRPTHAAAIAIVAFAFLAMAGAEFIGRSTSHWEERVVAAEIRADSAQIFVDSLRHAVDSLAAVKAREHRIVVVRRDSIRIVDSVLPPPAACDPNLTIRDSTIAAQDRELRTAGQIIEAQRVALYALQGTVDTLRAVLRARPGRSPFVGRNLSVGVYYDPITQRAGVGVSVNIGGIRLP